MYPPLVGGASDIRGQSTERYRITGRLGSGGMGEVLRAVHVELGRDVAIKRLKSELSLDQSLIRRFENEARAVNLIRHENIVEVTDFYTSDEGQVHMVMELLEGRSLGDLIQQSAPLPISRAAHIAAQIADALCSAHEHGVIHRDLKPENIFLIRRKVSDDYVKLLDFGIARLKPECGGLEATQSGLIIGTPVYMSPEQAKGVAVEAATDMYSLGVLLYEMLTGHWPFPRTTAVQMMMAHIADPPSPLDVPGVPAGLEALISKCLAKEPGDRPQSMRDVRDALEAWATPTKFTQTEEIEVARGLSDTFFPPMESSDEQTWDQDTPAPRALLEEEMTASKRPSGRVFAMIGGLLVLGALVGWWLIKTRETPDAAQVAAKVSEANPDRAAFDATVAKQGLPATPPTCKTLEPGAISALLRTSELLADGKPGAARPVDAEALAAMEALGNEMSPEVHVWRARASLQMGDAQSAIRHSRLAHQSCPTLAVAHATEGTAQAYLRNHEAAIGKLQAALKLSPDYLDARFNLAVSQLESQELAAALGTLSLVIEQAPELPQARYLRGQCALQLGDAKAAATDLRLAVKAQEDNANAWYALGFALEKLEEHQEAKDAYCRASKLGDTRAPCEQVTAVPPSPGWEVDPAP